jgi:hypothetical protein
VGAVEFVVRRIELYRRGPGFGAAPAEAVTVTLEPSRVLCLNGQTEIPKGLCGFHAAMRIWWMREGGAKPEAMEYLKALNPGLFRGNHGGPRPGDFYHQAAKTLGFLDNLIVCDDMDTWSRPGWMDADLPRYLGGIRASYQKRAAEAAASGEAGNWVRKLEVSNESFMWARYVNAGHRDPPGKKAWTDAEQYGYLPGPVVADVYSQIFLAAAEGVREAGGERVRLGGPCSHAFNGDDYGHFRSFVAPFIDRCHEHIGFLTEHHYFGQPDSYAASFEVAKAYCAIKLGKRIPIYNTECNDVVKNSANRAHYNLLEILECLRVCPDVVEGRAMHAMGNGYCGFAGETGAFLLLSTLRGAMLPVQSSDQAVVAVAARTHSDDLVVVLFNRSPFARTVRLACPGGCGLTERLRLRLQVHEEAVAPTEGATEIALYPADPEAECRLELLPVPAAGQAAEAGLREDLPARSGLRLTFRPTDDHARKGQAGVLEVTQSFWDQLFARVGPDAPASGKIIWREGAPAGALRARLRVITRDVHRGEGLAVINGSTVTLPWSGSNDECSTAQDMPIDATLLKPETTLEFRCADTERSNGFTVHAASILVDRER